MHPRHHLLPELHGDRLTAHGSHTHVGLRSNFVDSRYLWGLLSSLCAYGVVVLFHEILNLVKMGIPQCKRSLRVNKRNLIDEVLLHVLVPVLDEYIPGYLLLYSTQKG